MTRINLRLSEKNADIFVKLKRTDGGYEWLYAHVDTGAQSSLLPNRLKNVISYQPTKETFTIDQAGIAGQSFEGTEAIITLLLEDTEGNHTAEFQARCWFANTDVFLVGYADILDRGILHIDMINSPYAEPFVVGTDPRVCPHYCDSVKQDRHMGLSLHWGISTQLRNVSD